MNTEYLFSLLDHLAKCLGVALGPKHEVVLHDVRNPESSIVAIYNGHITGRKIGDSSTNLAFQVLKDPYGEHDAFNYRSQTSTGKVLKSSSIYFKDESGQVFAAVCINHDVSELMAAVNIMQDMMALKSEDSNETLGSTIDDAITRLLNEAIMTLNKPIDQMTREDKVKFIKMLDAKGVFAVKRSIDKVAMLLGISRVTVYGYINEIESGSDNMLKT